MSDGYSGFAIVVTVLLWVAGILQLAVLRDKNLHGTKVYEASRWLIFAGLTSLAARFTFLLWDGNGTFPFAPVSVVSVGMIAVGIIARLSELLLKGLPK